MPPENNVSQAGRHLAGARAILARPSQGVAALPAHLEAVCECLRAAIACGPAPEDAAGLVPLGRELAAVRVLLACAAEANTASMHRAGLLSGLYGRDTEAVPAAHVFRTSVRV